MEIGTGKSDITFLKNGYSMLGYGQIHNTAEYIKTRLYSRAMAFKSNGELFVFVCVDLCFVTPILKRKVMACLEKKQPALSLPSDRILLTAQHTHSGPSGFSEYGIYNMPTPGFHFDVVDFLGEKIAESIYVACNHLEPGTLNLASSSFAEDIPVGFNRSIDSYNSNPDVAKVSKNETFKAINRQMTLLLCKNSSGQPIGSINWFGVHTTSLSNDNHGLHFDNKGYACEYLEGDMKDVNHLAIFAQGSCGDVSPKFRYNPKQSASRGKYEGMYEEDDLSAAYNGKLQFEKAKEIINTIQCQPELGALSEASSIDSIISWVDFSNITIDAQRSTSKACVGLAFLMGVQMDGPGAPPALRIFVQIAYPFFKYGDLLFACFRSPQKRREIFKKYRVQGNKKIVIESGDRKIMGTRNISKLFLPGWIDESIAAFKFYHKTGALDDISWTPQVLPLQIVRLGKIIFIAIPFEITTTACKRLKKAMSELFNQEEVIVCPYSNAYAAYVPTPEEYQVQSYEGGHCYFGQWTLDALILKCCELAIEFKKDPQKRNPQTEAQPLFTDAYLKKWTPYETAWWKRRKKTID